MAAGHFLHLKDLEGVTGETVCNVCVLWLDKLTPQSLKGGTLKYLSNKIKCSFIIIYLLLNVVPQKIWQQKVWQKLETTLSPWNRHLLRNVSFPVHVVQFKSTLCFPLRINPALWGLLLELQYVF